MRCGAYLHTLRLGCQADAKSLAAIDADVSLRPKSAAQFAAFCRAVSPGGERVLVICQGASVDGFIVYCRLLDEMAIHHIAVRRSRHGQGLGHFLLQSALRQMQQEGATRCLLEVRQSNMIARRLYQKNAFTVDGLRKNYYPGQPRENAVLMSRNL